MHITHEYANKDNSQTQPVELSLLCKYTVNDIELKSIWLTTWMADCLSFRAIFCNYI